MKQPEILLVDDDVNIINSYRRTLRNAFNFDVALSGDEALKKVTDNKKYSVIVTDMQMPNMTGLELLQKVKEISPDTVRIMLTGNSDQQTAVNAVNIGDIFKFINKPCEKEVLIANINSAVKQHNLIISERILLNKTLNGVINVLTEVLALVNPDIAANNTKMLNYMEGLAEVMKLQKSWMFKPMIQLSQLGCIIFPYDSRKIIDGGLGMTAEEKQLFAQHPCLASDLVKQIPRMEKIAHAILYQEKCFNGDGIPRDTVKGKDIPLGARMLKVVIDFIRFEKQEQSDGSAFLKLEEQSHFYDPKILSAFKESLNLVVESPNTLIDPRDLKEGMIIASDIFTPRGQLIARENQKVSESLLHIINHCIENRAISGSISVKNITLKQTCE